MQAGNILNFLIALKQNNNREWFAENKAWYQDVKSQFDEIGTFLIDNIAQFDEDIKGLDVKDCVFRIYRDTRFSHDKTPYKTHFGVYIASGGGRKSPRAGYYLHIEPQGSFVASGVWCPEPNLLKELRQSVYDNIDELNAIRNNARFSQYFTHFFDDDKLKTVPKGFPKDFSDVELLKLKHYLVDYYFDDSAISSAGFLNKVLDICKLAHPFNQFFNYTVDEYTNK